MENNESGQKIGCTFSDCTHNCKENSTCKLDKIFVCPCSFKITTEALKDTACSSYEYSKVQHNERYM